MFASNHLGTERPMKSEKPAMNSVRWLYRSALESCWMPTAAIRPNSEQYRPPTSEPGMVATTAPNFANSPSTTRMPAATRTT